ncbi:MULTISPECIES: heavy metal-binding domain-containing protein [Sphingobacterium]|uniref:heavy metal-binding domain-containing protein n=1 Tax=Sphingobacterium TaxID=28453 RepID=UPI00257BF0A7|nr:MULTISPECIES: heavy metal-binding domain-containing protein [Sphingobacterium]
MIVTTTNSIEGREISRYNDPIAANVVIGTNIFSDIGAGYVAYLEYKMKINKESTYRLSTSL